MAYIQYEGGHRAPEETVQNNNRHLLELLKERGYTDAEIKKEIDVFPIEDPGDDNHIMGVVFTTKRGEKLWVSMDRWGYVCWPSFEDRNCVFELDQVDDTEFLSELNNFEHRLENYGGY